MQKQPRISLNALRVFAETARHQSIARAADTLGVTPSAVSHQIKKLESDLATTLFLRSNNAISLTHAGQGFLDEVTPGLAMLDQAVGGLLRDANELNLRVSATLAVRWLIPALERFKARHPDARIRIETSVLPEARLGHSMDMAIIYRPLSTKPGPADQTGGEKILADRCRPVLAPGLLQTSGYRDRQDIGAVPALTCTESNWDWALWARHFDIPISGMQFADQFDIDDAALHGAVAGLGMVLAPAIMITKELKAGSLVVLPDVEPVELGAFYLQTGPHTGLRSGGIVKAFRKWLTGELSSLG